MAAEYKGYCGIGIIIASVFFEIMEAKIIWTPCEAPSVKNILAGFGRLA